jgi:succinoglycan biosynthesis protein ExoV
MKLFYFHARQGNFGDDMNAWLWEELLPGFWSEASATVFGGIGTIISAKLWPRARRNVVFSSGTGYDAPPDGFGGDGWEVIAVRGPLTAKVLGLAPDAAVTDGAALLSRLPRYRAAPPAAMGGPIYVPHHASLRNGRWSEVCRLAGIEIVDPRDESRRVIDRIRGARLVIAESMHAAIVADTMGVSWLPVATSSHVNSFKWLDWAGSLGVPYEPARLPPSSAAEAFADRFGRAENERFSAPEPGIAAALAVYERVRRQAAAPAGATTRPRVARTVERALRHRAVRAALPALDAPFLERAARHLSDLAMRAGTLSDRAVFRMRVDDLAARLATLPAHSEGKSESAVRRAAVP